jgi:hypothetical protein
MYSKGSFVNATRCFYPNASKECAEKAKRSRFMKRPGDITRKHRAMQLQLLLHLHNLLDALGNGVDLLLREPLEWSAGVSTVTVI